MEALEGLRVIDFGREYVSAIVGQILADFGAEVVKIEAPDDDVIRHQAAFYMWHRGKKSVQLDLQLDGDRDQARRLAEGADVVLMTLPPATASEYGLDYEALMGANPGLVYASVSALGERSPYTHLPPLEGFAQAKQGGMMDGGQPSLSALHFAEYGAAMETLHGILSSLFVRERTGKGQRVRSTLLHGLCSHEPWRWLLTHLGDAHPERYTDPFGAAGGEAARYEGRFRLFIGQTKDGYWVQFAQYSPHLQEAWVKALGWGEKIASDPRWAAFPFIKDAEAGRELWAWMLEQFQMKTWAEWEAQFADHPDVGAEVFRYLEEALDHPQLIHNGTIVEVDDPRVGRIRELGPVIQAFGTPASVHGPAPDLGASTEEILGRLHSGDWKPAPQTGNGPVPRRPLEGITLVELAMYYAAPYGPSLLADLGARVIKIEPPRGDDIRRAVAIDEAGATKVLQGKESIALDLGSAEGRAIVHEIIKNADLVMTSYRGEVTKKLQIDYETFRQFKPDIVYVNAPGYGIDGPYAARPAYAPSMTAAIGATMFALGFDIPPRDVEVPDLEWLMDLAAVFPGGNLGFGTGGGNGDGIAANTVATALLLGLLVRERTGEGQEMLVAMLASNAFAASADMVQFEGKEPVRNVDDARRGFDALERVYDTREGWVFLGATFAEGWRALCAMVKDLGGVDLGADPRFATPAARREHDAELESFLAGFFRQRTAAEWDKLGTERKVPMVMAETPQYWTYCIDGWLMQEQGFVDKVVHPRFGEHPRMGPTVEFSLTPCESRPGCLIGQHSEAILREIGYTDGQIEDLAARKVVVLGVG